MNEMFCRAVIACLCVYGSMIYAADLAVAPRTVDLRSVRSAKAAGDYLLSVLDADGRFVYEYSPLKNKVGKGYNWLRHAGATIALGQLYGTTRDVRYVTGAARAAGLLKRQIKTCTIDGKDFHVLVSDPAITMHKDKYGPVVKTGGNALAAIAFLTLDEVAGAEQYKDDILNLCAYIRHTQLPNGALQSKYLLKEEYKQYSTWYSNYYAGEALVALSLVEAKYPVAENRRVMTRLLNFLGFNWVVANGNPAANAFDHWSMIGFSKALLLLNEEELIGIYRTYLDMLTKESEALLEKQKTAKAGKASAKFSRRISELDLRRAVVKRHGPLTKANLLDTAFLYCSNELSGMIIAPGRKNTGSFKGQPGQLTPTAIRLEGVGAIANLLSSMEGGKYQKDVENWIANMELARTFMLRCQYNPTDIGKFKNERAVDGGFRKGLNLRVAGNDVLRIDYSQHAISALLGW